ncbi:MAG: hypothetical protein IBX44_01705 [Sulfurospirillum sp.]|nr:hypothetical protein [Sulfurospirillum sp.]
MRFSYKNLMQRFLIPRPTLIEWQKKAKDDKQNWRVKHLQYLRDQTIIEEQTKAEIRNLPLGLEDLFLVSVYLFFYPKTDYLDKQKLKKGLRDFGHSCRSSIEYKHDFAKKIWSVDTIDGTARKIANYQKVFDIFDSFTAAQFGLFMHHISNFIETINLKISPTKTDLLDGLSWQELYMYDKYFSDKEIEKYFHTQALL